MGFLSYWCKEFFSHITVYKTHFRLEIPIVDGIKNIKNLSVVITRNEIIILGNHSQDPVKKNLQ
jgi:hypothetical protein